MLQTRMRRAVFAVLGITVAMAPVASRGEDIEAIIAIPAPTLTFASHFVAEDAGFFEKEGLRSRPGISWA